MALQIFEWKVRSYAEVRIEGEELWRCSRKICRGSKRR